MKVGAAALGRLAPGLFKKQEGRTYFCDPSIGLAVCFRPPSEAFMLDVGFVAGPPARLCCALSGVDEAGFAFEAILVVEAIAELSVKLRATARWHK